MFDGSGAQAGKPHRASLIKAAVVAAVAASWACTPDDAPGKRAPAPQQICRSGPEPLLKLTSRQYVNTVRDLLAASGVDTLWEDVEPALVLLPPDSAGTFRGLDTRVSQRHIDAYFEVARRVSVGLVEDTRLLKSFVGSSCAGESDPASEAGLACFEKLFDGFGRRAFRRPLSAEEAEAFGDRARKAASVAEGVREVVFAMLMSPAFLYHFEVDEPLTEDDAVIHLGAYPLAARLSYLLWQTLPDDELLAAAASGDLLTRRGYRDQVDRLLADKRAKEVVWDFFAQWWHLEGFRGFSQGAVFKAHARDLALGLGAADGRAGAQLRREMVEEIRNMVDHFVWDAEGSVSDLMATDRSFSSSEALAALYGGEPWDESGPGPRIKKREGVLTRAALLVTGDEKTGPFHRGALVQEDLLCEPIPAPDPAALPPGSLDEPPPDESRTTRQRFFDKTDSPECQGCHRVFNDIGFVLEAYDSLGRYRTEEKIFSDQGYLVTTLPVDTTATLELEAGDPISVNGPEELVAALVESGKMERCFAERYFQYVFRRVQTESDTCTVEALHQALVEEDGSMQAALRQVVLEPAFFWRGVESQ